MIYLNKIVNPVYQYRYGAKQEIKEVLQCVKNFQKAYYPENQEMIFEPISIYYICSELIEMAELPENPYLLQVLQEKYQQAETKSKNGLLFTLEELFGQGWLQKTEEEWLWNNSSYEYKGLTSYCNQKEKQIVMFLQSLIDTKYKDGIYPRINEESIELFELLNKTGLSVEWLIEKKFLLKKKDELYINTFSKEWEQYGERVLSKKYEEWNCADNLVNTEKWICFCEVFTRCWEPEKHIQEKEQLFVYCIKRLEQEESSWEQEVLYVSKAMQIACDKLKTENQLCIPEYGVDRQRFIQTYFERWCRLGDNHSRKNIYYGICLRNYSELGVELQKRFRKILMKPCFEIQYFHLMHWQNEMCSADCVEDVELFFPAVCNLFHYIRTTNQKEELKIVYIKQLVKPIWNICYNGLHQENKRSWVRNFAELLLYLYEEGGYYRKKRGRTSSFANTCEGFLEIFLQHYFKEISEINKVDNEIIDYLLIKLDQVKDHKLHKYLGVMMLLGKYGDLYVKDVLRKNNIFNGVFKGLKIWTNLSKEKDVLLSTISWQNFSEIVWHKILVNNQDELIDFFYKISMKKLKSSEMYKKEKSLMLGVGVISLLGLYFRALCVTELRDKLSGEIRDYIEVDFVDEFINCHNEWRLFSGENINLADSSVVLSKCMDALSFLKEDNRKLFIEKIEIGNVIDVVFWLEFIKNQDVKTSLLNILIDAPKEKVFDGISFFSTWQHAIDNILELCFAESEKETSEEMNKMLEFVEYSLDDFEEAMNRKPESIRKDYKEWQENAYCRVLLLKNQKEEILNSKHDFYKGIVWLNSDQLVEIQRAKALFVQKSEESVPWRCNYLIACVLEIVKKKELGLDYDSNLIDYERAFSNHISTTIQNIYFKYIEVSYIYGLFVYLVIEKKEKFWALYDQMPQEMHCNKKVVNYVIEAHLSSGNVEEAKKQFEQLKLIYGETTEIKKVQERIEKEGAIAKEIKRPLEHGTIENDEPNYKDMRNLLYGLLHKSDRYLADIILDENEFQCLVDGFDGKKYDKQEIQVVSMVCQALKSLQNYSVNLLHNNHVSSEDAYNRTLKLLFNLREERFLGFRLDEQTQGGKTKTIYRFGEQGVGRRDLILVRKERAVALLEGIKLWRLEKGKIEEHISKLKEYNVERVPIVIMPIYGHMKNEKNFWDKYIKLLHQYKKQKKFDMVEVVDVNELLETEFSAGVQYIVKTRHNYQQFEVEVYHIMIIIKQY